MLEMLPNDSLIDTRICKIRMTILRNDVKRHFFLRLRDRTTEKWFDEASSSSDEYVLQTLPAMVQD